MKPQIARRFASLPAPVRGAAWMVLSGLFFSLAAAAVRHLTQDMHFIEIAFFRSLFGVLVFLPWFWRVRLSGFRTRHSSWYLARGVSSVVAMFLWFGALSLMPIADATSISFSQPIFISIAAVILLSEPMRANRWIGLVVGFAGTLIILRPGFAEINIGALMVLGGAVFIAGSAIIVKIVARDDPPDMIAMYQVLYMLPMTFAAALFVWTWPTWDQLVLAAAVGVFSTFAQRAYTRAYALADASAVTPFDFMRLPFAVVLGFVLFTELPDLWTLVGGVVIFVSSMLVVRGETGRRNRLRSSR